MEPVLCQAAAPSSLYIFFNRKSLYSEEGEESPNTVCGKLHRVTAANGRASYGRL